MNEMKDPRQARKAPRAPGTSFADFVREYAKHGPVPDYLRIDKSEWLGDEAVDVDRYITKECHELEKEKIWKRVWQMACREEEIPEVGDAYVYEITDISILVVRVSPTEIKAYYNVCLHQGRLLRDPGPVTHNTELRCPFHGFCWKLDGKFMFMPSQWDFPQIDKSKFGLKEVKVGRWGGFVFINMDPNCESLESYMGDMSMHWEKFPLEDRYIACHINKIVPANWKVGQEAFMEAFHAHYTHPQFALYFGAISDNGQYDPMGNYSRALGQGSMEQKLDWQPTREDMVDCHSGHGFPGAITKIFNEYLKQDNTDIMSYELEPRRAALREVIGDKVDQLSAFEIYGGGYFTLFPNFHPWWAYDEITYRFRPYKNDPEKCIMEVYLLRPFKGERPKPEPTRYLGENDSFIDVADVLGINARTFEQDEFNMPSVQKGLHNLKALGLGVEFSVYQQTKIRHFHKMWDKWTSKP